MKELEYRVVVNKVVTYELEVIVKAPPGNYNRVAILAMQAAEGKEFKKVAGEDYSCTDIDIINED